MEEELSDNGLEERIYSMLHYIDDKQATENTQNELKIPEIAPRSTVRRYWRTSEPEQSTPQHNVYQKINTTKEPINNNEKQFKEEKSKPPLKHLPEHLSIFQIAPQNLKKTVEIIEDDDDEHVLELESSDEDEVVEVALPPKPTITIDSSDDENTPQLNKVHGKVKPTQDNGNNCEREVSASPVPSIVSSVSDEFIRGDCIALNISSRRPDDHSFDFSLHGPDLLGTPARKKKKKKGKETSTPVADSKATPSISDGCFATPKSKAKNKTQKQKTKTSIVTDKTLPNPDIYDSDSNQSVVDIRNNRKSYSVTDKSLPSIDVYESDSNQSEIKDLGKPKQDKLTKPSTNLESSDSNVSLDKSNEETPKKRNDSCNHTQDITVTIVDLTDNSVSAFDSDIQENIIMGNVTGFMESEDYGDEPMIQGDGDKFASTKVPAILYDNLDFDNLKGKAKFCKNRRYSLSTLRAEMEKFYNDSWGGENFNHREIQKNMSRDKSLWAIDPKDRMPNVYNKKKVTCNFCNRVGHRDDTCRMKPPVCYMCGNAGHMEPRCPSKICVNCGSPNHMYSTMCRNCSTWSRITCAECGQNGHPSSHCPDTWRRYHNTTEITSTLEESHQTKKHYQTFCSGCTRRGHLVHTCRFSLPFSGLPINSPYVRIYRPLYFPNPNIMHNNFNNETNKQSFRTSQESAVSSGAVQVRCERFKRQSKSPTMHESHVSKKKNTSFEVIELARSPNADNVSQRKISQSKDIIEDSASPTVETENDQNDANKNESKNSESEKAPDFIPIGPTNRDKRGQLIQDNEVSDTSDVVTSARIYVTNDIVDKLKTTEGEEWLKNVMEKHDIVVENTDINSFLSIKGKVPNQEAFQTALRDWIRILPVKETPKSDNEADVTLESENDPNSLSHNIPKNRNNVLKKLSKALDSLKEDLGEPNAIYRELNYLQNRHDKLMKQKVISPQQLSNSRNHINDVLKKLNMILLGQAGLADGSKHLSELYSLHRRLITYRQKNLSGELRKEIGQHYHSIFASVARDDYDDLLKKYYGGKSAVFKQNNKDKSFVVNPKKKSFNTILSQPSNTPGQNDQGDTAVIQKKNPQARKPLVEKTRNKLVFYHKRLLNTYLNDKALKKTRMAIVRRLHSHIASLFKNSNSVSSKMLKKMKKVQEQAQTFLNKV